jgi:hypothetical protein
MCEENLHSVVTFEALLKPSHFLDPKHMRFAEERAVLCGERERLNVLPVDVVA